MEQNVLMLLALLAGALGNKLENAPAALAKVQQAQSVIATGQALVAALPPGNTTTAVSEALTGLSNAALIAISEAHPVTAAAPIN